jgi:hypothetical protein
MNRKENTQSAIHSFIKKNMGTKNSKEKSGPRNKPEKKTESDVLLWAKSNGFFLHVIDSSTYDPRLGQKGFSKAQIGFPDLVGNTIDGLACFIELKAKDRQCNVSESQRHFLEQKIEQNCFAVVIDSAQRLRQYWVGFCQRKNQDEKQKFLKECLPKTRPSLKKKVLIDEFGF